MIGNKKDIRIKNIPTPQGKKRATLLQVSPTAL